MGKGKKAEKQAKEKAKKKAVVVEEEVVVPPDPPTMDALEDLADDALIDQTDPHVVVLPISTHLDEAGHVHMVDIGAKAATARRASARARVHMLPSTLERLKSGSTPKGDVLATARIAAIQAAKRTPDLIPLAHYIQLTKVTVDVTFGESSVELAVTAEARDRTGVEMEALTGASAGALTLYDMLKGIDRGMRIEVELLAKAGGKSGPWSREG
jgi:cyclic pyranopterin phosphate synthase